MDRKSTRSLGAILADVIRESGLDVKLAETNVLKCFDQVVGASVVRMVKEKSFNAGTLKVKIESSMVKNYLTSNKVAVIKRINDTLKSNVVNSLILY